jgi:hypothetical protein
MSHSERGREGGRYNGGRDFFTASERGATFVKRAFARSRDKIPVQSLFVRGAG